MRKICSSLDRNRTCIWSFGNSYTIHCTTRPKNLINIRTCIWSFGNSYTIPVRTGSSGRALYYEAKEVGKFTGKIKAFKKNNGLFNESCSVCSKYLYSNSQKNYTKKFSHSNQSCWSDKLCNPV